MNSSPTHWDRMYKKPLEEIPWEIKEPPQILKDLIDSGDVPPGRALDLACGTGNYSLYLAGKGFDVTGIDFSEKALEIARQNAAEQGLNINFVQGNVLQIKKIFDQPFDFILEYSLLHHIAPDDLKGYTAQFPDLLAPGGKFLVVCYSEKDEDAAGHNSRTGKYGNTMYYRTADEIRKMYPSLKETGYWETRLGKRLHHAGHAFLFAKPSETA